MDFYSELNCAQLCVHTCARVKISVKGLKYRSQSVSYLAVANHQSQAVCDVNLEDKWGLAELVMPS